MSPSSSSSSSLSLSLFLGLVILSLLSCLTSSSLDLFHHCVEHYSPILNRGESLWFRSDQRSDPVKECVVCLEWFKKGEKCMRLVGCNHVFHSKCVNSWLIKVLNCPICRGSVKFNLVGSGSFENDDYKMWWHPGV
ncbi:hypothetical protein DCAR_0312440 [Daucus carota subsp. sativus]|uniref:RING-type domain-containing protein n=1 Tax=Daucus carota subsp. sativus TaxID=79200 RepID=A0AAF0WPW5_DAUCS|nr:hypothetical protein DCAR_0312440 [Daucus carota subsp. sativus]